MKYETMLKMQNELNSNIDGDWKTKNYDYQLAITVELSELIDHIGYKWWKKQETNIFQCKLEVVDIFHFYLCDTISLGLEVSGIKKFENSSSNKINIDNKTIKSLITKSSSDSFSHNEMYELMSMFMTYEELYIMYIAKNILNKFRNKNGYKTGTYVKIWHGEEDNSFLERVMLNNSDVSPEELMEILQNKYDSLSGRN